MFQLQKPENVIKPAFSCFCLHFRTKAMSLISPTIRSGLLPLLSIKIAPIIVIGTYKGTTYIRKMLPQKKLWNTVTLKELRPEQNPSKQYQGFQKKILFMKHEQEVCVKVEKLRACLEKQVSVYCTCRNKGFTCIESDPVDPSKLLKHHKANSNLIIIHNYSKEF